jgi:putative MFS transporter
MEPATRAPLRRSSMAFACGVALMALGVAAHVPDLARASEMGYRLSGMPMSALMWMGIVAIVGGLALATWALLRRTPKVARAVTPVGERLEVQRVGVPHVLLALIAMSALVVDVLKPATIGFVLPGLRDE